MAMGGQTNGGISGAQVAAVPGARAATSQRIQALHSHYGLEPQGNGSCAKPTYGRRRGPNLDPICYASWSCNPVEQNYSSFDGECLAVLWDTNHFRAYLFGNSFTLITDHEPLRWLMTTQKLTGKMARWNLLLQEYDFTV